MYAKTMSAAAAAALFSLVAIDGASSTAPQGTSGRQAALPQSTVASSTS
jgi:hypothetical protein